MKKSYNMYIPILNQKLESIKRKRVLHERNKNSGNKGYRTGGRRH